MRAASILAVVAAQCAVAVTGCALDDPAEVPSWQVDVMPVLAANCVRCHGHPRYEEAPSDFRLDAYGSTLFPGQSIPIKGASELAVKMAQVTRPGFSSSFDYAMPPDRTLDERSYRILRNWAGSTDAMTDIAPRGLGHPDNHEPAMTIDELGRGAGTVTFGFDITDLDRDLVTGVVLGPVLDSQAQVVVGNIGVVTTGRGTFVLATTDLPAGSYDLTARLDDGADIDGPDGDEDYVEVPLMTVTLP